MIHTHRTLTADEAYDQLMAWVADHLNTQGLVGLSDQTKRLILLKLITETPDLATRLPPTLAQHLADAAGTLLHRLPPELADRVRQIVSQLAVFKQHAAQHREQEEAAS